jgi:peptide/nickel transport system permease protein
LVPSPLIVDDGPAPEADWRIRVPLLGGGLPLVSGGLLAIFILAGAIGPLVAPHDANRVNLSIALLPPVFSGAGDWAYPLGTDQLGRDILSRLIGGARVSLLVAMAVVVISGSIGLVVALLSGYLGGRVDAFLMRLADAALAFPYLLLAVVIVAIYRPSAANVIIVLALAGWSSYARVIRSEVLGLKTQDFVTMALVMGAGPFWVIRRHLLPNVLNSLSVLATLQLGLAIVAEGSLSFLGLGVPPPAPSWGGMLAEGRQFMVTAWWLPTLPGLALSLTVLSSNLVGNWLRTRNDPTRAR